MQPTPAQILDHMELAYEFLTHGQQNPRFHDDCVGYHAALRVEWCSTFNVRVFDPEAAPALLQQMRARVRSQTAECVA